MRRLMLLIAAGALWLFLAAIPAFADGGPHVAAVNSGTSTLTADSCAGCHRAHTAKAEALLVDDANQLCLNCHNNVATGASVDVMTGVQYKLNGVNGSGIAPATSGDIRSANVLGYVRDGGYQSTYLDTSDPQRVGYNRAADTVSFRAKVPVTATPHNVTSAHIKLGTSGITSQGHVWGNGLVGSTDNADATIRLECISCHNPHGNQQYRILNTLPAVTDASGNFVDPAKFVIKSAYASTDRFFTTQTHGLIVGDIVTIQIPTADLGGLVVAADSNTPAQTIDFNTAHQYVVVGVPSGDSFQIATLSTSTPSTSSPADVVRTKIDITTGSTTIGSSAYIKRYAAYVTDAPAPAAGTERNYTIQQVRGYQGNPATYLLYSNNIITATSNYAFTADIVGTSTSFAFPAPSTSGTVSNVIWTGLAHGFAVGDTVHIVRNDLALPPDGDYTVASIPSSNTFTLTAITIPSTVTAGSAKGANIGTVTKVVNGTFGSTAGDAFHRTVPWNPNLVNSACDNNYNPPLTTAPQPADTAMSSACLTANDAPNGQPATVSGKLKINNITDAVTPSAYGQVAFNDQITAWCSTCHTRYYSNTNPNPTGTEANPAGDVKRAIQTVATTTITVTSTVPSTGAYSGSSGFSVGDAVQFSQIPGSTYYVVSASSSSRDFKVSTTFDGGAVDLSATVTNAGTVVRTAPGALSSWAFERPGDNTYKFQHQTTTNRACTTCHVGHGSSALMTGFADGGSTGVKYPDGTIAPVGFNSRLLKIDNRGTCQMCHDPTGTAVAGAVLPVSAPVLTVP